MRIYYSTDIHGSERCFRKFLGAASFYKANVLILGGDITGKVMVPVVETTPGRFQAQLLGQPAQAKDEQELGELEKRIRFNGLYPYRCSADEYRRLEQDEPYRTGVFRQLMRDEVARWMRLAEERLGGSGIRCFVMPGNDDEWAIDEALASDRVVNPDGRLVDLDGWQMISSAWTNRTPWASPREADEEDLYAKLSSLAERLDPARPAIFNLHCPPHNTPLDRAPALTADLRVVSSGGEPRLASVGSTAVRRLIEERQPALSLHGHVHESRAVARIGRTLCVNPGSAYSEGVIDGAVVELRHDRVKSCQLVSG